MNPGDALTLSYVSLACSVTAVIINILTLVARIKYRYDETEDDDGQTGS